MLLSNIQWKVLAAIELTLLSIKRLVNRQYLDLSKLPQFLLVLHLSIFLELYMFDLNFYY